MQLQRNTALKRKTVGGDENISLAFQVLVYIPPLCALLTSPTPGQCPRTRLARAPSQPAPPPAAPTPTASGCGRRRGGSTCAAGGGHTTGGVRRQSGRVSLQYRKAHSRWRHMRSGGRDRAWISPEEVDFVDGRQHDGHLTVALEQTDSRLSSTNYLFIYFHPKYVTSVCVTSVCLYLRGLDQL